MPSICHGHRFGPDLLDDRSLFLLPVSDWLLWSSPISDVSGQGDKVVITTSIAHHFLKRAHPIVSFSGTGVPKLDLTSTWKVRALSSYQLTLHGEQASIPLDTSTGHIRLSFPRPFLCMGMWRCPLLGWCLFFAAATAGVAGRLNFSLIALACGSGFCTGLLAFAFWRRQGFDAAKVGLLWC